MRANEYKKKEEIIQQRKENLEMNEQNFLEKVEYYKNKEQKLKNVLSAQDLQFQEIA